MIIAAAVTVTPAVASAEQGAAARQGGVNPYLSFIPGESHADVEAWRNHLAQRSARQARVRTAGEPLVVKENEPPGVSGRNDSTRTAERIRGFGTAPGAHTTARILGQLSPSPEAPDVDFYRFDLRAGDVFAAQAVGEAHAVGIFDPAGVLVQGSAQDFSILYPAASPLPRGGNAIADHVVAHEVGHYIGSWHTDPANATVNIMDAGSPGADRFFGVGPDGVGGTPDDTDNDLVPDVYRPSEGFTGTEDAVNRTAFGLTGFRH